MSDVFSILLNPLEPAVPVAGASLISGSCGGLFSNSAVLIRKLSVATEKASVAAFWFLHKFLISCFKLSQSFPFIYVSNFIFVLSWSNTNCHFQSPSFISCQPFFLLSDQQHSSFLLTLNYEGIDLFIYLLSASIGVKICMARINSNIHQIPGHDENKTRGRFLLPVLHSPPKKKLANIVSPYSFTRRCVQLWVPFGTL